MVDSLVDWRISPNSNEFQYIKDGASLRNSTINIQYIHYIYWYIYMIYVFKFKCIDIYIYYIQICFKFWMTAQAIHTSELGVYPMIQTFDPVYYATVFERAYPPGIRYDWLKGWWSWWRILHVSVFLSWKWLQTMESDIEKKKKAIPCNTLKYN